MAQPAKPAPGPAPAAPTVSGVSGPADADPPYRRVYVWFFQAWILMFLGVICCALTFYLLSYIPK